MIREIYLAGGCYWGTQKFLDSIRGIIKTETGFANGHTPDPSYGEVKRGDTGYAETVHAYYDDSIIDLSTLLKLFFNIIDPVSVNHQGEDYGSQYRTGIYTVNDEDMSIAKSALNELQC